MAQHDRSAALSHITARNCNARATTAHAAHQSMRKREVWRVYPSGMGVLHSLHSGKRARQACATGQLLAGILQGHRPLPAVHVAAKHKSFGISRALRRLPQDALASARHLLQPSSVWQRVNG